MVPILGLFFVWISVVGARAWIEGEKHLAACCGFLSLLLALSIILTVNGSIQ